MATKVEICSNALMLLGDSPIASFTEGTKRSTLCANLYPLARRDILRKHSWNCVTKRVVLSPMSTAPAFGNWSKQFVPPGDLLRLLAIGTDDCPEGYSFEGKLILANTDVLRLRYIADLDEGQWDSNLTNVMIQRMAMDLAYPITKSASLRDSLKQEFYAKGVGVLAQAKTVDGQENIPEQFGDSPFITARG